MHISTRQTASDKWTVETVLDCLCRIEQTAGNKDTLYLVDALIPERISRRIWMGWRKKFAASEGITEQMDLIEAIFESKLFHAALDNKHNASVAIFALKNNHQWGDRSSDPAPEQPVRAPLTIDLGDDRDIIP
jgi:hypothetical protein